MSKREDLAGRTVVVTGASSGFGRGTALKLGELGAHVVVAARRPDVLDEVVAQITDSGGTALAVPTDVSDADAGVYRAALKVLGATGTRRTTVEAIAAECVDLIPGTRLWTVTVDADAFWEIAARHDLTEEAA